MYEIGDIIIFAIVTAFLMFLLSQSKYAIFILYIVLALVGKLSLKGINIKTSTILGLSFVICFIFYWVVDKNSVSESFKVSTEESDKQDESNEIATDEQSTDNQTNSREEDDDEEDEDDNADIDMSKTFLEAYQNLNPDQISSMTSETQKLIETQKQLMETLKSLTPVVKQGKELMDGFKGHFGGDKEFMKTMKAYLPLITKK